MKSRIMNVIVYNNKAYSKVEKILKSHSIEIDCRKPWHTKGFAVEIVYGDEYGFPFQIMFDACDSKKPQKLFHDICGCDSKKIIVNTGESEVSL